MNYEKAYDYEKAYKKMPNVCGAPFKELVSFFNNYTKNKASVLDLGCGQGRDAIFIAEKGHSVTGVDISSSGISQIMKIANKKSLEIEGIVKDIVFFKTKKRFDIIILDRVLHILSSDLEKTTVLKRASSYIKNKGYILIADTPSNTGLITSFFANFKPSWKVLKTKKGFHFLKKA